MLMTSISFCGDIRLLKPSNVNVSEDILGILSRCEYNVINFEAPIDIPDQKGIEKSGPCISQHPDAPAWVEKNGWNVVSLANNHVMDYGNEGFLATKRRFQNVNIIGAGSWEEAYKPLILISSGGYKIAIIACSHREFGCLHDKFTQKDNYGYTWICHPKIEELIVNTKNKVDYLFIFVHAGVEHLEQPLPEWRTLYKHFIDMGCDGVIASHPHIPMGNETYNGKPIYYSLGNLCFQKEDYKGISPAWFKSIMVEMKLNGDGLMEIQEHLICYDPDEGGLSIDFSESSLNHIKQMNKVLSDDDEYMNFINNKVEELLPWYMKLFKWSGLVPIPQITEIPLRTRIKNKLLFREYKRIDNTTKTHLLNNLQCESHRWAIERALKLKYGID